MKLRAFLVLFVLNSSACVQHDTALRPSDCANAGVSLAIEEVKHATSCDATDGSIHIRATGGVPPYSYRQGNLKSDDGLFDNLASGAYTVSVADANGCEVTVANVIVSASNFSFSADITDDTDCTAGNGAIAITPEEGSAAFEFRFMDGEYSDRGAFDHLEAGDYHIDVRNADGCSSRLNISVPHGTTGTSWSGEILPLVETHCAQSGCHNGVSRPDLRVYANAKFYASQMKALTADGSMPFEGSITQAQIDLIACWVDEGALNN